MSNTKTFKLHAISLAVMASLSTQVVYAEEDEAAALKMPANAVEMGLTYVPTESTKYGEYNGLNKMGTVMNGGFQIKGGAGYGQNEQGETERWSLSGDNLGLSTRNLKASRGSQGEWGVSVEYDELRHYTTSNYSTPYAGTMGGNLFSVGSLRNSAGTALTGLSNTITGSNAAGVYSTATVDPNNPVQPFTSMDVYTERKNTGLTVTRTIDARWSLSVDYNQLVQSGAKLMSFASAANQRSTYASANATTPTSMGQFIALLPNPTNYRTDTITAATHWLGDQANFTASYHGSFFRDQYTNVKATNYADASLGMQTWSTPPSNDFHQFNMTGGYALTDKTKLVGGFSYGRNTQNRDYAGTYDSFMYNGTPPANNLNGLVVTTHADLKLTHKSSKNLTLTGALKYDDRNNKSDSNLYDFYAINYRKYTLNGATGTVLESGDHAVYANAPLSTRKMQMDLASDYRLGTHRFVRLGFVHSDLDRKCAQYAETANCVVAKNTKENKLDLSYRDKMLDGLGYRVGYAYNTRRTESDPTAVTPMVGVYGNYTGLGFATSAAGLIEGKNAGDFPGFYPMYNASRNQHVLKLTTNLQLGTAWALSLGGRYSSDKYLDYGYKLADGSISSGSSPSGRTTSLDADLAYNFSEEGSVSIYAIKQNRTRQLDNFRYSYTNANSYTIGTWSNELSDADISLGLTFKQTGLAKGTWDVEGDLSQTVGLSRYTTTADANYTVRTSASVVTYGCSAAGTTICNSTPDIRNSITTLRLTGTYHLDKTSKVVTRVVSQRLNSSDYFYNGYQATYTPTSVIPTNQNSGSYQFNVVSVNYVQQF
jgi:MtrB/PioB family decaheme-associated outer membrane protein